MKRLVAEPVELKTVEHMRTYWAGQLAQHGEHYVNHLGKKDDQVQVRFEHLLKGRLKANDYFEHGMDFGCGLGRFLPLLSQYCGHLWAVELLPEQIETARRAAPNVTGLLSDDPLCFPAGLKINFLWACMVFQHIVDDQVFERTCAEIVRVLKPGARVILVDNAVAKEAHIKPRTPAVFAQQLQLMPWYTADRPLGHWMIDGIRK